MSRDKHYPLRITPLSPVHMGTDHDYDPTGYVIEDKTLYEFDGNRALDVLPGDAHQRLTKIVSQRGRNSTLLEIQQFFHEQRERLIAASHHQVHVPECIEAFYRARVGRTAPGQAGRDGVQNRLAIERTAWNPATGEPMLPGSGLKGAVRTALLDWVNDGNPLKDKERGCNRKLQRRRFGYLNRTLEKDPMRLIRVDDALPQIPEGRISKVQFAVNHRKRAAKPGEKKNVSQAAQKGLYQMLECLHPEKPRAFGGGLAIADLGPFAGSSQAPSRTFTLGEITDACNRFFRDRLDRETKQLRTMGVVDEEWLASMHQMLDAMQPQFDGGSAFLLRVGRHSGAESVTLNGLPRQIKIMLGKNESGKNESAIAEEAKTMWLAGAQEQAQRGLIPFGWLLVEIEPSAGEAPPVAGCLGRNDLAAWQEKVSERLAGARNRLAEERAQLAEAERRAAAEAEAERKREEERQRQMAAVRAELPEDAAYVEERRLAGGWKDGNDFLADIKAFLAERSALSEAAWSRLHDEMEARWKGVMAQPDAVQGKKAKPKYRERPRALAKRLLAMQPGAQAQ